MRSILHVIDSLAVGGAEKLLVGIINELDGFEQHLMLLHGPETLTPSITSPCKVLNLQVGSFSQLFTVAGAARKYIRDNGIDIVHSHLYESNLLARLATPRPVCLINSIHAISSLASYKVNRKSLWLEKLTYRKRHTLVAVSRAVMDDFNAWVGVKGKNHVLYNFIDDKFFLPDRPAHEPGPSIKLVAVGNLRYQKNYPYLVEAFKYMPAGVQLDIYGQGDLEKELQQQIDAHKLNIRLMGVRDDLEKVLPSYDAFVMSSFYEGQPLSLLEASACGLPALLSDIPVLREVLEDDALYFNINNPDSLVSLVKQIQEGKHDLRRLSKAAARKVASFAGKENYVKKLAGIYEDCR